MSNLEVTLYLLPTAPLITRGLLTLAWYWQMSAVLPEEAQERDFARTTILSLAGFSFTAVAGLSVVDAPARPFFDAAIWCVFLSFLSYIVSLNLQAYKATRWQNQLAQSLLEVGTLGLLLALVALIGGSKMQVWVKVAISTMAVGGWFIDHMIRIAIDYRYLESLSDKKAKGASR